ncbi:MAG: hypothetical protein V1793_20820 [Pseudomonadota bacterium]
MADFSDLNKDSTRNTGEDEDVIELTEVITDGVFDEEIIELTEIIPEERPEENLIELTDVLTEESLDDEVIELNDQCMDQVTESEIADLAMNIGAESGYAPALAAETEVQVQTGTALPVAVTREELEAALERVIEKHYAQIIEAVLKETVQAVLEKEISALRSRILGETTDRGKC